MHYLRRSWNCLSAKGAVIMPDQITEKRVRDIIELQTLVKKIKKEMGWL